MYSGLKVFIRSLCLLCGLFEFLSLSIHYCWSNSLEPYKWMIRIRQAFRSTVSSSLLWERKWLHTLLHPPNPSLPLTASSLLVHCRNTNPQKSSSPPSQSLESPTFKLIQSASLEDCKLCPCVQLTPLSVLRMPPLLGSCRMLGLQLFL